MIQNSEDSVKEGSRSKESTTAVIKYGRTDIVGDGTERRRSKWGRLTDTCSHSLIRRLSRKNNTTRRLGFVKSPGPVEFLVQV